MMKKFFKKYFPLIPIGLIVINIAMFSHSCANTTTPPTGGPKDTIPPVLRKVSPEMGTTNVGRHKAKLQFTFNEYVVVKDPNSIFLSPPLEKKPKYKIQGKSVVVFFENDLDSARTYVLDLTNAIGDNNEGNMFPGYSLVFSTGERIDSMMMTGTVVDCNTLKPIKGATVMLYKDHADSALFLHRPDAAVKTDEWGYFAVRNIQDTLYRLYAIVDENSNNIYDPDNDKVAFVDSLVKPVMMVNDSLPELQKYDMKDTLACQARKSEHELAIFREKPSKQMIVNKERVGERTAYITFMAPQAQIDSIWIRGVKQSKLITQFNLQKDSLEIWVNDPRTQPDTLYLNVNYLKTDTTGVLAPAHEVVKLAKPRKTSPGGKPAKKDQKKEDTLCVFKVDAQPERIEQYGFEIEFKYPIVENGFDSLTFRFLNPKQQEVIGKYKVTQDSLNLRRYTVWPEGKLLVGYEYFLKFPHRKFKDINGFWNDSTEVKVTLPNDDKLSTLIMNMSGVSNKYIVDLLNEKRDKVLRTYIIDKDQTLTFPYLKAAKYSIRITEDVNRNGMVDTGKLLEHIQPEKVKFYKLEDGQTLIDIPEMSEIEQSLNIAELFE
ncbi:MAG: Ig-like domain-containing protein [Bacteroidales bacterium]|nr:Ig-like domain-containing protein [Bacteroidales bacterium]